jgi:hypothetical protein
MFYLIKVTRHISRYVLSSDRLDGPKMSWGCLESGPWPPEECSRGAGAPGAPGARNAQNLGRHLDGASGYLRVAQCSGDVKPSFFQWWLWLSSFGIRHHDERTDSGRLGAGGMDGMIGQAGPWSNSGCAWSTKNA